MVGSTFPRELSFLSRSRIGVQRGNSALHIEITFATRGTTRKIKNWKVEEEESHSLHNYISFQMEERTTRRRGGQEWEYTRPTKDGITHLIWEYEFMLQDTADTGQCIKALQENNRKACWKKKASGSFTVYFWTEELGNMKKDRQKKRKITRARGKGEGGKEYFEAWCEVLKREMKKEIRRQKRSCWLALLKELDTDLWGQGYKIVMGKLNIKHQQIDLSIE